MARPDIIFSKPLPDRYESQMPAGLTPLEQYTWRERMFNDLRMKGQVAVASDGQVSFIDPDGVVISMGSSGSQTVSKSSVDQRSAESEHITPIPVRDKSVKKSVRTAPVKSEKTKDSPDFEEVKYIPKSVMAALRRMFSTNASKADLISAAVYILTQGDCEISPRAMELVAEHGTNSEFDSLIERILRLEAMSRQQLEMLQSIELCTCFNTFDRRYGSNEPRTRPGATEFREQDNLDMLERLRAQARDQLAVDSRTRGRQIYNWIKGKND